MNAYARRAIPLRLALGLCAVLMSIWAELPMGFIAALGILVVAWILAELGANGGCGKFANWCLAIVWLVSFSMPVSLWLAAPGLKSERYLDIYYATLAWLIAGILLPVGFPRDRPALRLRWNLPGLTWAACGASLWIVSSYLAAAKGAFYVGILTAIALLVVCRVRFRLPPVWIICVNTCVLLLIALPTADLIVHPPHRLNGDPAALRKFYSYEAAKKDPAAFQAWWNYFWGQVLLMDNELVIKNPLTAGRLGLRPNRSFVLVQSRISINSRGFRGPEQRFDKENTYRIVVLGESSTFGFTTGPEERPWPELLERIINEHLKPPCHVEVINAGLPGATLVDNLQRLAKDILPLQPDMIISYHGINGLRLLNKAMPSLSGTPPPPYRNRAIQLLADCEYRLKLACYRHKHGEESPTRAPTFSNLGETEYARAYRELINITRTNGIRLVLANFSMALNERSPDEVIEFFRSRTPRPRWHIEANAAHSLLLKELARRDPEVILVDSHPDLDGEEPKFLDLVHFNERGEEQMAQNIFQAIRPLLTEDLARRK